MQTPDISTIFCNYLRNSRPLSCPICQEDIKPPTLTKFKHHVQNNTKIHPTEEKAILDAFQRLKLNTSKPQSQPTSTTNNNPQNERSKKRSALDQPDDQQNLERHSYLTARETFNSEGRSKKVFSPGSSHPPPTPNRRRRGRQQADNARAFDRETKSSNTPELWSPSSESPVSVSQLIWQSGIRIIPHELVAEWKRIYSGPVMAEMRKHIKDFSSGEKEFYVSGSVNGTVVEALPDTGAETCFISPHLTSRLGLDPIPGVQKTINLANNNTVESPGMVTVLWKFSKERITHTIHCWILPGCVSDLVLGRDFLEAKNALEKVSYRIKSTILGAPKRLSLNYLGNKKQRLRGYLNGHLTAALPDTGSNAMFINGAYARKRGLNINSDVKNQAQVGLANGSIIRTSGIVRDVEWKVGSTTVQCNFYVLENLCVDVILSDHYLFGMDIFSKQHEHLFDIHSKNHSKDYPLRFCILRLVKKKRVVSPKAFVSIDKEVGQLEKEEELYRRDKIRDEIMALPEDQREAAAQAEDARQKLWEAQKPERETKRIVELHMATWNVQKGASGRSRWKKRISVGFFGKGVQVATNTRPTGV